MPGRRYYASRLIGRQLFGNERLMLGYRQKARRSSRLSLAPEPASCQSKRRRHRGRSEAPKAEEASRGNCRPQNGELGRGLPAPAPLPTEVRGMFRPARITSTQTPGEAQTALAVRPTPYIQAHQGGFRHGITAWPTGEKGHLREFGAQWVPSIA
jgi:hypothetical protein